MPRAGSERTVQQLAARPIPLDDRWPRAARSCHRPRCPNEQQQLRRACLPASGKGGGRASGYARCADPFSCKRADASQKNDFYTNELFQVLFNAKRLRSRARGHGH
eukprot:7338826-Prymnesium_polylepis.1